LEPFAGGADDVGAIEEYGDLDCDDGETIELLISSQIRPHFETFDEASRTKIKVSLAYFLSDTSTDFGRIFHENLVPFAPPNQARKFFLEIWQGLFGTESWEVSTAQFEMIDHSDPTELMLKQNA
jgi:hypothetical protein